MVALPGLGSGLQPWCPLDLSTGEKRGRDSRGGRAVVLCDCGAPLPGPGVGVGRSALGKVCGLQVCAL